VSDNELISRRTLLVTSTAALALGCAGVMAGEEAAEKAGAQAGAQAGGKESAAKQLAAIRARIGGRLGVHALDTQSGRRIGLDDRSRYAMASTFKLLLAACILSRVDRGELSLARSVPFGAKDLSVKGPVTAKALSKGSLTIEELCAAVVEVSDNGAANLLLGLIGGPPGFTTFVRALGDTETRLDRTEPALNSNLPADPRDTTTPRAMVDSMEQVLLHDALSKSSREHLTKWLMHSRTGLQRLRAGLPAGWKAGDKTGTGQRGAANDLAIVWPPARKPILIAVYMSESQQSTEALSAAHADIARVIARAFAG
jgi:beta-lactamase class A